MEAKRLDEMTPSELSHFVGALARERDRAQDGEERLRREVAKGSREFTWMFWVGAALVVAVFGVWFWGSAKASNLEERLDARPTWSDVTSAADDAGSSALASGYAVGYLDGIKGKKPRYDNDELADAWHSYLEERFCFTSDRC